MRSNPIARMSPPSVSTSRSLFWIATLWFTSLCPPALGRFDDGLLDLSLEELLQIPVTSFRSSVVRARDLKRTTTEQQDAIVSEDVADFPDLNLAEALQRMPGIAITREGGEGRQITVRGLSANFSRVTLNGMDALTQSASTLDSRNTVSTSRAFDFNVFSADLFSQLAIQKTYTADTIEGGIASTVELRTPRPFDFAGFTANASVKLGDNHYTSDSKPQLSLLVSNTWDKVGALAAVSYSQRDTVEQGYSTSRWRTRTTTAIGPAIDSDTASLLAGGLDGDPNTSADNLWFARLNRTSYWANTQERLGLSSSLQVKPSAALSLNLDLFYGEFNNDKREHHLATNGSASTALGTVNALEYIRNGDDLEVVYGEFSNVNMVSESRIDQQDTRFYHLVLNGDWHINERLSAFGLIGRSHSDLNIPVSDKVYLEHNGGITTDFRRDRFYGTNQYDFDTADSANWTLRELDLREDEQGSEITQAKTALDIALNKNTGIKIGIAATEFTSDSLSRTADDFVRVQPTPLNQNRVNDIDRFASVLRHHKDLAWTIGDVQGAQQFYGLSGGLNASNLVEADTFAIKEQTHSAFALYRWQTQWFNQPVQGNIGLRHFTTRVSAQGMLQASQVNKSSDYSDVLPAANLAWNLTAKTIIRLGASQNITRPDIQQIVPTAVIRNDPNGPSGLSVQAGNPDLQPIKATNLDLAWEYYVNDIGYVSLALFSKQLDGFVVTETSLVPYRETGYPLEFLGSGQDANTLYTYARPINSDATDFEGLELSFHSDLDFLPAPFNHLGVITNYTHARGTANYRNVQGSGIDQTKDFIGLSRHAANATLYYETGRWGARVSANYRDRYILNVEGGLADEDERGYHAATHWDISAFYKWNDQLKLTLEGINLTNQREELYSDSSDRLYGSTYSGSSYFVGLSYMF